MTYTPLSSNFCFFPSLPLCVLLLAGKERRGGGADDGGLSAIIDGTLVSCALFRKSRVTGDGQRAFFPTFRLVSGSWWPGASAGVLPAVSVWPKAEVGVCPLPLPCLAVLPLSKAVA